MTPHEEKLVLELHSQWGNRWSRIARRLPGRTDNEIKNYWRTHMRKKAQERKRAASPSSSSSNCCSSSSINPPTAETNGDPDTAAPYTGTAASPPAKRGQQEEEQVLAFSMDEIWKVIASPDEEPIKPVFDGYSEEGSGFSSCPPLASPLWEYSCPATLWKMDDEESKMFFPTSDQQFLPYYEDEGTPLPSLIAKY